MSLVRYGKTDEQKSALVDVMEYSRLSRFRLCFGSYFGESPRAIKINHNPEDGIVKVYADGTVKVRRVVVRTLEEFKEAIYRRY